MKCPSCQEGRLFYTETLYIASIRICPINKEGRIQMAEMETVEIKEDIGCRFIKCTDCGFIKKIEHTEILIK